MEAFLTEHGMQESNTPNDVFDEDEIAEVLAATWRERRSEVSKLQKTRRFAQANVVKKQFSREVTDLQKRSRCRACGQIGHWARNCPQKGTGSSSGGKPERDKAHGAAVVEEALLVSSPGYGIIDSGCSRTLIGQDTLNQFLRLYHEQHIQAPTTRPQHNLFRFGNGQEELSEKVVSMPVTIHGRAGRIECCIIKGEAPLLLSRNTMKSLRAVLDFEAETISIEGSEPRPLQKNSAGQYIINVMDRPEALLCEEERTSGEQVEKEVEEQEIDEQDMSLVEGCERTLTRREYRCLLAHKEAWEKGQSSVAVAELFSPPRFSKVLEQRGEQGLAFDIKQGWDLTNSKTQNIVDKQLDEAKPELLVCCPECKHWGGWYRLNRHKLPVVQQLHNQRQARAQAEFCAQQIRKQLSEEAECYWNTHGPVICGSIPQFRSCCRVAC